MKTLKSVGTIIHSNKDMEISFPEYPEVVKSIKFKSNDVEFLFNYKSLKKDAIKHISELAKTFNPKSEKSEELVISLSNNKKMHISYNGNHIRFTLNDKEDYYWSSDEFEEHEECENILGAIAGITC